MPEVVRVSKARPVSRRDEDRVADVVIHLDREVPDYADPNASILHFTHDAGKLFSALVRHLPGGTLDQLLIKLLHRKAERLRVRG